MAFNPAVVSNLVLIGSAFSAAFLAALWASLAVWTYRDARRRMRDPLLRTLSVLMVVVLFLPGVLVYWILRPARTLEEEYQQAIEEEALLQSIEERPNCPGCGRRVREEWNVCPTCATRLKRRCMHCGKPLDLTWNHCPFCATPVGANQDDSLLKTEAEN